LYDTSPKPQGYAGGGFSLWGQSVLEAVDVRTGEIKWAHEYSPATAQVSSGILTTAGGLLFTGSTGANLVAHDPATGRILWHQRLLRAVSNGPSRAPRSTKAAPSSSSSALSCRDNVGCATPTTSAARVKLRTSATARKYLSCCNVTAIAYVHRIVPSH